MRKGINADAMLEYLAGLPRVEPTDQGAGRIRSRAHLVLERQRHARSRTSYGAVAMNAALVLVSCVYLVGAVAEALRLSVAIR